MRLDMDRLYIFYWFDTKCIELSLHYCWNYFFKEKAQIAVINVITFEKRGQLRRHVYEGTIANHSSC